MNKSETPFVIAAAIAVVGAVIWWTNTDVKPAPVVRVWCQTTKGKLDLIITPEWSPRGAERFLTLVDEAYLTNVPLYRCVDGFLCQFGAHPNAANTAEYPAIPDDPPRPDLRHFRRGYLSFAGFGPNSRANQLFLALAAVPSLGRQPWETPFGYVTEESMRDVAAQFTTSYGDLPPAGQAPAPAKIEARDGAAYLKREFPELDYITECQRAEIKPRPTPTRSRGDRTDKAADDPAANAARPSEVRSGDDTPAPRTHP